MQNVSPDDPITLRRADLLDWAQAAGFQNIDVRHLGDNDYWEMRFACGDGGCNTPAEVERVIGFNARGCRCRIAPGQFVAVVMNNQAAARFRLQPIPQPEPR